MIPSRIPDHPRLESEETTRKTKVASMVPRACDGCRSRNLRCVPTSDTGESAQCQRCNRTSRECVFEETSKNRRRRRTDVRVRELEKKIEVLASLWNKNPNVSLKTITNTNANMEIAPRRNEDCELAVFATTAEGDPLVVESLFPDVGLRAIDTHLLGQETGKTSNGEAVTTALLRTDVREPAAKSTQAPSVSKAPIHWRRAHIKSKNGCKACKKRKVKVFVASVL